MSLGDMYLKKENTSRIINEQSFEEKDIKLLREIEEMMISGRRDRSLEKKLFNFFSSRNIKLPLDKQPAKYDAVIPLFYIDAKEEYQQYASGVLLQISNDIYLLTSAHVISNLKSLSKENGTLYFANSGLIKPVVGQCISTRNFGSNDTFDFAYIKLDRKLTEEIIGCTTLLQLSDLEFSINGIQNCNLAFTGYPFRKSRTQGNDSSGELYEYVGPYCSDEKLYQKYDYSTRQNIIISFDLKQTTTRSGDPLRPIVYPEGISGGAIFTAGIQINEDIPKYQLVGITHSHHTDSKIMVGTKIENCLDFIRKSEKVF